MVRRRSRLGLAAGGKTHGRSFWGRRRGWGVRLPAVRVARRRGLTAVRHASFISRGRGAAGGAGMAGKRVLGIVLAGTPGRRLTPLTAERGKAAVPVGGLYRLVDFALSNLANGGIRQICVLTQYKSHSLDRHLATAWGLGSALGGHVIPVPAQQWRGTRRAAGHGGGGSH